MEPEAVIPVDVVARLRLKLAQRREPLPVDEPALSILLADLSTELSYGHPFADGERFIPKTSRSSSMAALLSSGPLSAWKTSISSKEKPSAANADLASRASLRSPAARPTISRLHRPISRQT